MTSNKNLIEILHIEGNEVAVSRQGINNCMVNLTQMAKPYGANKAPDRWLRTTEAKEFLAALEEENLVRHIWRTEDDSFIIKKQGGHANEQGTWCTDYHVAIRFAMWLNPHFGIAVIDGFIKFLTGRNVGTLVNTRILPAPKHREGFRKLEAILRRYTSLANLKEIAKRHNVTLHHVKDVLSGNSVSNPVLQSIIDTAKENKNKGITFPDWRIRKKGIDYSQTVFDFEPQDIVELNGKED